MWESRLISISAQKSKSFVSTLSFHEERDDIFLLHINGENPLFAIIYLWNICYLNRKFDVVLMVSSQGKEEENA